MNSIVFVHYYAITCATLSVWCFDPKKETTNNKITVIITTYVRAFRSTHENNCTRDHSSRRRHFERGTRNYVYGDDHAEIKVALLLHTGGCVVGHFRGHVYRRPRNAVRAYRYFMCIKVRNPVFERLYYKACVRVIGLYEFTE